MATFQRVIETVSDAKASAKRRNELIQQIEELTGRPLLVYVADFDKPNSFIQLEDKTGFSDLVEDIGGPAVDVLIHSPGGFAEVVESLVCILRSQFLHVRFAVPNAAKSAATLLCLSGDELLLDNRSELGPIDPQAQYTTRDGQKYEAAEDILDGFGEARRLLQELGPSAVPAYVPLLDKLTLGLLQGCEVARELSRTLANTWLKNYMFKGSPRSQKPKNITEYFASRKTSLSHGRAIGIDQCLQVGLVVNDLRKPENAALAALLWELWCVYELHFERTPVNKVYENAHGCQLEKMSVQVQVNPATPPAPQKQPPARPSAGRPGRRHP